MAIGWNINRNEAFYSNRRNDGHSFQEHNQRMIAFRLAHPDNWQQRGQQNASKVQDASEVQQEELLVLVPMREVVLASYSRN